MQTTLPDEDLSPNRTMNAKSSLVSSRGLFAALVVLGNFGQSAPTKWRWFARHAPDGWSHPRRIMTLSDSFTFPLAGERAGDASTAAFLRECFLRLTISRAGAVGPRHWKNLA